MASFEFLALIFTGLGLTASIVYYASILRNANNTQQMQLETRQAQLFMQSYRETSTVEIQNLCFELMAWEWKDFEDFNTKYLAIPEQMGKFITFLLYWHGLGIFLHENYIPIDILYKMDQDGAAPIMYWTKFEDVILGMRRTRNQSNMMKYFEQYVDKMSRIREDNGLSINWSIEENKFID